MQDANAECYVLAVDLGTSGPKAAVISLGGRIVATARAPVETLHLPEDGAEQDPDAVWRAVKAALGGALRNAGVAAKDVLAVICSSQYSSIVPVDSEGRATMNMVLWLDKRGKKRRLEALPNYPKRTDTSWQMAQWLRVHGLPPVDGGISLTHMRFIKYARPEAYARTAKFLEPMDFVALRLSGRAAANQCTAFMSLATDNRKLNVTAYDARLLRYAGIEAEKLPELVPVNAILGAILPDVAAELGLSPETKVITGINDTQSGGLATYAFRGAHAGLSVGSSSVMITHVPFKRTDVRHAILSMPSPVPGTYFVMAENGLAGSALAHFMESVVYARDRFGELTAGDRYALLQQAIEETPPGSGGVLFLPWMGGALAPSADARMRGGFLNLSASTTRSHLARAVLEGVAMNLRWLRGPVEKFAKRRLSHFLFYGGGAESAAWSQIMADVLDAPVHQLENPQYATCLGAGLLAFERLGLLGFDDFQQRVKIRQVYEPNPATRAVYDEMSDLLVAAFKATQPIFRRLNSTRRA